MRNTRSEIGQTWVPFLRVNFLHFLFFFCIHVGYKIDAHMSSYGSRNNLSNTCSKKALLWKNGIRHNLSDFLSICDDSIWKMYRIFLRIFFMKFIFLCSCFIYCFNVYFSYATRSSFSFSYTHCISTQRQLCYR